MDPLAIRREMEDRPATADRAKPKRQDPRPRGNQQPPARTKQPRASERSSMAAQDWYDRGEAQGFALPYDVNYLALAIQRKVEADPRMGVMLAAGEHDKVSRWLAKMVANWWDFYVDGEVHASNAKEYFLGRDWEDVRDWAHSNLRKDYLREHGKRVDPPIYPNAQEFRQRLEKVSSDASVQRYIASQPELGESPELDPEGRGRLRSFANRRRRKK